MNYEKFCEILNSHVFKDEKKELLRRLANSPERFIGLFRPTKPSAKILQHLLQSLEIKFGTAMEELISEFLKDWGFEILPKEIISNPLNPRKKLNIDQYFTDGEKFFFIEQKVRDDHDSTKKRGQIANFEAKLEFLYRKHGQNLVGIMYFIDPDFVKNKNYYIEELNKMTLIYGMELHLLYGKELFEFFNKEEVWNTLLSWLTRWKESLPELPEINFDSNPQDSFDKIKNLEITSWRKILENEKLWEDGIMLTIFRNGETLKMLFDYYKELGKAHKKLAEVIKQKLERYYVSKNY